MPQFRKKPVTVDAVQWNGVAMSQPLEPWFAEALMKDRDQAGSIWRDGQNLAVFTVNGITTCTPSSWIVRTPLGDIYPCTDDVFRSTHEPVPTRKQESLVVEGGPMDSRGP